MKTKLMFAALAAAAVFTACNKENPTMEPSKTLKSVEISLGNLIYTKGDAIEKINANDPVKVNDIQVFLVKRDGSFFTGALESDGKTPAQYEFSGENDLKKLETGESFKYHYVDTNVEKVVVVANVAPKEGEEDNFNPANYADLQAMTLQIDDQQDPRELTLYGEGELKKKDTNHTDDEDGNGNVQENQVYTSKVTLVPRVARIEVDGFRVLFNETPIYKSITFTQLAIVDYMPTTALCDGAESGTLVNPLATYYSGTTVSNETAIYNWFGNKPGTPVWTYDACSLTCTPAAPAADFPTPKAYHIFACKKVPTFFIHLTADGVPAFLYTKSINIKDSTTPLTELKEGYIYRMGGKTVSEDDGAIEVPEDKIDPMDRCLEITVEVVPWQVVLVTPEF